MTMESVAAHHDNVANETAVPMTEHGHSTEVDENADKPAWFY
jgi:hypothetical protein